MVQSQTALALNDQVINAPSQAKDQQGEPVQSGKTVHIPCSDPFLRRLESGNRSFHL
jgi:hypothetical protein